MFNIICSYEKMFCSLHLNLNVGNLIVLYSKGSHTKLSCCWFLINLAFFSGKKLILCPGLSKEKLSESQIFIINCAY